MKCPKCYRELAYNEISKEQIDRFRENSITPETIVFLPKRVYYCYGCGIKIEETLDTQYYKKQEKEVRDERNTGFQK
ncbi:hypothetical protein DRN73_08205 [Candidatus Pacearchaeota archaeon]|nr:MAG: hypothetical protein DRN73_08205 [Candidatus Pacearchaeota archaeon]